MLGTSARLLTRTLVATAISYRILAGALSLLLSHALGYTLDMIHVQVDCIHCRLLLA
tara:strand:- start:313 stop:483 length:171 start_codon:yes stop_codon:yes gene_type:complete